jgi:hypothetical protein
MPLPNYQDLPKKLADTLWFYRHAHEKGVSKMRKIVLGGLDFLPKPGLSGLFAKGEKVIIKDSTFEVVYVNETCVTFEYAGIPVLRKGDEERNVEKT